ncbi:uncharacterized protein LOC115503666 isoform X2 [Lynx canadensis]|uniref:uncharacterized protein LOC115503666 isoform X2 n=1 Tax=Lynx canadensis TaxID=61383 RepID=UPI0011B0C873|nr:uncharacterized protein LOC115503666 isoform X2 [Lynx canadensis]
MKATDASPEGARDTDGSHLEPAFPRPSLFLCARPAPRETQALPSRSCDMPERPGQRLETRDSRPQPLQGPGWAARQDRPGCLPERGPHPPYHALCSWRTRVRPARAPQAAVSRFGDRRGASCRDLGTTAGGCLEEGSTEPQGQSRCTPLTGLARQGGAWVLWRRSGRRHVSPPRTAGPASGSGPPPHRARSGRLI